MMDEIVNEKTEKVAKSVLLLQNTEVLEINSAGSDKKNPGYSNITLAVTPEEALKLFYAQTNGKITVLLRPILETDVNNLEPYVP
jgi:Flp pilus assembly protein CpaB